MNHTESNRLALSDVLKTLCYDEKHAQQISKLTEGCPKDTPASDVINALAWWIVQDLYSEASTDQVNLERIAFGLETASRQLLSLETRLRDIGRELQN